MKISIDTTQESIESLRHTIRMLEALITAREGSTNDVSAGGILGMFGDTSAGSSSSESSTSSSSGGGLFDIFKNSNSGSTPASEVKKDEKIPEVRIIEY